MGVDPFMIKVCNEKSLQPVDEHNPMRSIDRNANGDSSKNSRKFPKFKSDRKLFPSFHLHLVCLYRSSACPAQVAQACSNELL